VFSTWAITLVLSISHFDLASLRDPYIVASLGFVGEKLELVELQSCESKVHNISIDRKKRREIRSRRGVSLVVSKNLRVIKIVELDG